VGKFCPAEGRAGELTPQETPQPAISALKTAIFRDFHVYSGWHEF
jgi:hypothetical protein